MNRISNLKNIGSQQIDLRAFLRNKKVWGVFGAVFILAAGTVAYRAYANRTNAESASTPQVQTAVARQGDLVVFASGAGSVVAATQIGIGFDESGTLSELMIQVGDKVTQGQALARLQTDKTEQEVALAVAEAQLNALTAQQTLDDIYASAQVDAAQALLAVEDAEQALEDLNNPELRQAEAQQALAQAQEAVKTAERSYYGTRSTADTNTIAAAYAELVLASSKLKDMQAKFDDFYKKPDDDLEKANVQLKLSQAQSAYDTALRYYNAVTGTGSELDLEMTAADLAAAQAQLAEAERAWERLKDGPTPGEIALAQAQLAVAQATYETLKKGPDPAEIALAEANLMNAKTKLEVALQDQAVVDLLAPMDGTIMSISASVGETIGSAAIISIADLSQPVLEVYLDEADINSVVVGYEADVVFDSLPDSTFTGRITEVNPSLTSVGNVDTVQALVQLDADSFSKTLALPVGANASVDVIGGRAQNAVLVPVEALRELGPEEYAVFVMEDGKPKLRVVTVGLMDYTSAQILTGLEAGEIVTTGVVETNQ